MFKKIFLCNCVGTGMVCYMILFVVAVTHCAVVGCKKKQKSGCDRSFYRFPAHPEERRRRWIAALHRQRKDGSFWSPGPGCRVCSDHFISGKKSDDPLHPDYVPTQRLGQDNSFVLSSSSDSDSENESPTTSSQSWSQLAQGRFERVKRRRHAIAEQEERKNPGKRNA